MANSELGEKECPACEGTGRIMSDYPYSETCPKCKGKGTLDWIENIVGVVGTYIKPGVYTREVDYSQIIQPGEAIEVLIASEDYELLGEINGE
jgi:RecJ-like exonuclease